MAIAQKQAIQIQFEGLWFDLWLIFLHCVPFLHTRCQSEVSPKLRGGNNFKIESKKTEKFGNLKYLLSKGIEKHYIHYILNVENYSVFPIKHFSLQQNWKIIQIENKLYYSRRHNKWLLGRRWVWVGMRWYEWTHLTRQLYTIY